MEDRSVQQLPVIDPAPYSFGNAFDQGWELFTKRYTMLVAGSCTWLFLTIFFQALEFVMRGRTHPLAYTLLIALPVTLVVLTPLRASTAWAAVAAARGQAASTRTLFRGFERFWAVVALTATVWLFSMAVAIPLAMMAFLLAMLGIPGVAFLMLLMIPLGVIIAWLAARVVLSYQVVLDPDLGDVGPFQALSTAFRISEGIRGWSYLGLSIVCGIILGLSTILFLIPGFLFGAPLFAAVLGMAYEQLVIDAGLRGAPRCESCGSSMVGFSNEECPQCGAPTGIDPLR